MNPGVRISLLLLVATTFLFQFVLALPDPTGHWPFDEGTGTNTVDISGNANHGTLKGSPVPIWTSGVSSNALEFDGVQNEVQVPNASTLTPTNALTLVAWV